MIRILIMLPLVGGLMGYVGGGWRSYRGISIKIAILNWIISIIMWIGYEGNSVEYQYVEDWGNIFNKGLGHMIVNEKWSKTISIMTNRMKSMKESLKVWTPYYQFVLIQWLWRLHIWYAFYAQIILPIILLIWFINYLYNGWIMPEAVIGSSKQDVSDVIIGSYKQDVYGERKDLWGSVKGNTFINKMFPKNITDINNIVSKRYDIPKIPKIPIYSHDMNNIEQANRLSEGYTLSIYKGRWLNLREEDGMRDIFNKEYSVPLNSPISKGVRFNIGLSQNEINNLLLKGEQDSGPVSTNTPENSINLNKVNNRLMNDIRQDIDVKAQVNLDDYRSNKEIGRKNLPDYTPRPRGPRPLFFPMSYVIDYANSDYIYDPRIPRRPWWIYGSKSKIDDLIKSNDIDSDSDVE